MHHGTERSPTGNSAAAMELEAASIAARRPDVVVTRPDTSGPQFYIDVWRSLAEYFVRQGFPGLPQHLSGDCGLQVAESLFRAANAVEWHLDAVREIEFAEQHADGAA